MFDPYFDLRPPPFDPTKQPELAQVEEPDGTPIVLRLPQTEPERQALLAKRANLEGIT